MIFREFDELIPVLDEGGYYHHFVGDSLRVQCPAHDGGDAECSFRQYDDEKEPGEVILEPKCFSHNCDADEIWAAVRQILRPKRPRRSTKVYDPKKVDPRSGGYAGFDKSTMKWERTAVYYYRSFDGKIFAPKVRLVAVDKKTGEKVPGVRKMFVWDVKAKDWPSRTPPLYRGHYLAGFLEDADRFPIRDEDRVVYLVEGEKDADRLARLDVLGVSLHTGSGSDLSEADVELLANYTAGIAPVVIVADLDEVGRVAALRWKASLEAASVTVELRVSATGELGSDVSDHLDAGFSLNDLILVSGDDFSIPSPIADNAVAASL